MKIKLTDLDRVHDLWDQLADYKVSDFERSRRYFLESLCKLLGSENALWIGAVRMNHSAGDTLNGWRVASIHKRVSQESTQPLMTTKLKAIQDGSADIITIHRVAMAGTFRVHRLVDIAPEGWFESDYYRKFYLGAGVGDSLWAGIPLNEDAELYIGVNRGLEQHPFSEEDVDTLSFTLKGLKWFHRLQMLGEGLGIVSQPLTPTERKVLEGLLRGLSEKRVAAEYGQSQHTVHGHIKSIYKKYGVTSRSALMALWLTAS